MFEAQGIKPWERLRHIRNRVGNDMGWQPQRCGQLLDDGVVSWLLHGLANVEVAGLLASIVAGSGEWNWCGSLEQIHEIDAAAAARTTKRLSTTATTTSAAASTAAATPPTAAYFRLAIVSRHAPLLAELLVDTRHSHSIKQRYDVLVVQPTDADLRHGTW